MSSSSASTASGTTICLPIRAKAETIAKARNILITGVNPDTAEIDEDVAAVPAHPCPCCGGRMTIVELFEPGFQPQPVTPTSGSTLHERRLASLSQGLSRSRRYCTTGYAIARPVRLVMWPLVGPGVVAHSLRARSDVILPPDNRYVRRPGYSSPPTPPALTTIPIVLAARPSTTSAGSFPGGFPTPAPMCRTAVIGRHPKTFTKAGVSTCNKVR